MGIASLNKFEPTGGSFSNFTGTVVACSYSAFAYYGKTGEEKRTEGFFHRWEIVPDPGEDILEYLPEGKLVRYVSGGKLAHCVPAVGTTEGDLVNLESKEDEKLHGPYAWRLDGKDGLPEGSNIDVLYRHVFDKTNFDKGRVGPRVDDMFVGMRAVWVEIAQPERDFKDKASFRLRKEESPEKEQRKPTILAPDSVLEYVPKDKLPKAGATGTRPVADSATVTEMETFISGLLAKGGPLEQHQIQTALISTKPANMPNMLTLTEPGWLFDSSRPWASADGKMTAR